MTNKTKKVALYGLLVALAFIFSYIESLIPFNFAVPGIKLGLANIVVMIALYTMKPRDAFAIALVRVILTAFTFGNLSMMMYSLAGSLLSLTAMILLKSSKRFSMVGVSITGGVMHNVGQILMAMWVLDTVELYYYLPVLMVTGVVTGILIGILGAKIIERLPRIIE